MSDKFVWNDGTEAVVVHDPRDEPPPTPVEQRIRDEEAAGVNLIRCRECGQKVHLRRARRGLCFPCHDAIFGEGEGR